MTIARRTVEDPNGDIVVNVDSVDLGPGAGDVPYVKLVGGAASSADLIESDGNGALLVADLNFGTAAALADNTANPTIGGVQTYPMAYDGSTWDRQRGDSTDGLLVNLGANNDVQGTAAAGAGVSGNPVQVGVRAESTTPAAVDDGDVVHPWATLEGAQVITFSRTRIALTPTIDTAVYADLDRLGSVTTVTGAALRNGGAGQIVNATLVDDAASNFSIEAWFFRVTPTMANADNGVFDLTDANLATADFLGTIDFWSANSKTITSSRVTPGTFLGGPCAMHYSAASGDTAIYMILRARGAYDAVATDDLVVSLELLRY